MAAAMQRGAFSREEAIQRLVEFSEGGLTRFGAADMIDGYLGPQYLPATEDAPGPYERFRDWPVDGIHRLETDVGFTPEGGWYGP